MEERTLIKNIAKQFPCHVGPFFKMSQFERNTFEVISMNVKLPSLLHQHLSMKWAIRFQINRKSVCYTNTAHSMHSLLHTCGQFQDPKEATAVAATLET